MHDGTAKEMFAKLALKQRQPRRHPGRRQPRSHRRCAVPAIARNLQAALDDWQACEPQLRQVYEALNSGAVDAQPFDQAACASPAPRAYQWADGSAYVNHVELVRKARNADAAPFYTDPLMYQGGSDSFSARATRWWPTRPGASTSRPRSPW